MKLVNKIGDQFLVFSVTLILFTITILYSQYEKNIALERQVHLSKKALLLSRSRLHDKKIYKRKISILKDGNHLIRSILGGNDFQHIVEKLDKAYPGLNFNHVKNIDNEFSNRKRFEARNLIEIDQLQVLLDQLFVDSVNQGLWISPVSIELKNSDNKLNSNISFDVVSYKYEKN